MSEHAKAAPEAVSPTEFVDARLEEHKPSRLWRWWVASTPKLAILKLLGLDQDEAFKEQVARNARTFLKVIDFQNRRIEQLESALAFYEQHSEVLRSLRKRFDAEKKGSRILTIDAAAS